MVERNYPLCIGLTLSLLFGLVALFGPSIAPHDPMKAYDQVITIGDEMYLPFRNPIPPFTLHLFPLGTDDAARDILSRVLWGVRPTLLLCLVVVSARLVIGVPLGLLAGWYRGPTERFVDAAAGACVSIPALVFALAAVSFLGAYRGLSTFLVGLSLTGWADITLFVKSRALSIRQAPYIEGAQAVGVKSGGILRHYVFPQLWPVLPILIAFEMSAAMLLVSELGFLGTFIGGGFTYAVEKDNLEAWTVMTSGYPELGQMLSNVWAKIIKVPWEPLIVGIVVFAMIFGFNLLGEGLRRQMDYTRARGPKQRRND